MDYAFPTSVADFAPRDECVYRLSVTDTCLTPSHGTGILVALIFSCIEVAGKEVC
jgi:hypothetical protein